ncbi:5',5'''-P-1,P-4-tetraphosphate phosphorylase [Scheffersomyces xylosifermentans]|uniref:5',5'''-P-1,P-4-tetraphosphate phosphorylase n=1 Tax=Scheffersomyces xylosifermentans TaxID=1304137 RepID=UPI00315DB3AE
MSLTVPTDFYERLTDKYEEAVNNGHIIFNGGSATTESVKQKVGNSTIDFQLTLLKSLQHRPDNGTKAENPFAKPEPELTILNNYGATDEFRVVFNKFPVVPKHFMIITKEFKSQNTPLAPNELQGILSMLRELLKATNNDERWFAFYNSGPESGASQPHKHIQFMTFPDKNEFVAYPEQLASTSEPFLPNVKQEPLQNPDLPFAHFVARLPDNLDDLENDDLNLFFASLLQRSLTVSRQNDADHISYNFVMTTKYMMIVPRRSALYKMKLGINSCGVVGLVLCKNEELFDLVKADGPENILKEVGFPNTAGQGSDEYHY